MIDDNQFLGPGSSVSSVFLSSTLPSRVIPIFLLSGSSFHDL